MQSDGLTQILTSFDGSMLGAMLRAFGQPAPQGTARRVRLLRELIMRGEVDFGDDIVREVQHTADLIELCLAVGLNRDGRRSELERRLVAWFEMEYPLTGSPEHSPSPECSGARSDAWEWWPTGEVFELADGDGFHVDEAKVIISRSPRPIERIRVRDYAGLIPTIPVAVVSRRKKAADLSIPLIVATVTNGGLILIDGWHRVARAIDEGVQELPCVILTRDETKQVRL